MIKYTRLSPHSYEVLLGDDEVRASIDRVSGRWVLSIYSQWITEEELVSILSVIRNLNQYNRITTDGS